MAKKNTKELTLIERVAKHEMATTPENTDTQTLQEMIAEVDQRATHITAELARMPAAMRIQTVKNVYKELCKSMEQRLREKGPLPLVQGLINILMANWKATIEELVRLTSHRECEERDAEIVRLIDEEGLSYGRVAKRFENIPKWKHTESGRLFNAGTVRAAYKRYKKRLIE